MKLTTSPLFDGGPVSIPICGPDGTAALPTYTFCSDTDTGIFLSATAELGFSTGGTQRLVVDASGNVGIGTSTPNASAILDLSSVTKGFSPPAMTTTQRNAITTPPAGLQIFNTTTSSTQEYTGAVWQNIGASGTADPLLLGNGTAAAPTYSFSGDSNTGIYLSAADTVAFTTGGTLRGSISTTQNTWALPHRCASGSAGAPSYSFSGDPDTGIFLSSANKLAITTAATERLVVDGSGNIGIGVSPRSGILGISPRMQLEGTTSATSSFSMVRNVASTTGPIVILGKTRSATTGGNTLVVNGDDLGTVAFVGGDGTDLTSMGASIKTVVDGAAASNVMPGALVFSTNSGGASVSEAMRIDKDANVGIGTTAPDGRLHVHTASAGSVTANALADDLVVENSASGGISILVPDANNSNLFFGTPTDNQGAYVEWDYTGNLFTLGSQKTGASVSVESGNGVEAIRIDSSQNVGIGIATPDGKLHVHTATAGSVTAATGADDLVVENNTTGGISILTPDTAQGSLILGTPSANQGAAVQWLYSTGAMEIGPNKSGATLSLKSDSYTEAVKIDSTQHVDIKDSLSVNTPTGGDKGAGSINAKALYDDGVQIIVPGTISNTSGAQVEHVSDDSTIPSPFTINGVIAAAWESVGPTGSGATNIWTALDSLPSDAKWVRVRFHSYIGGSSSGVSYVSNTYGRSGASSTGTGTTTKLLDHGFLNQSGSAENDRQSIEVTIPVDGSQIFDLYYSLVGTSPTGLNVMSLVSFGI